MPAPFPPLHPAQCRAGSGSGLPRKRSDRSGGLQTTPAADDLPGEEITRKLSRLETIITRIFQEVEKQPELASYLRRFMNYYLPTTRKLVDAYREIELDSFRTEQNEKTKKEIEDTLDTINQAFEKLLNSFFEERAMDISSDISVLHSMLAQEGLTQGAFEQKTGYKDQT